MSEADYEIRVRGELGATLRGAFEEFDVCVQPVETVLYGVVLDQPALHGLLRRVEELGLELIEVRRLSGRRHVECPSEHTPPGPPDA